MVLLTRGFRLDQPRDMYFDEVYHARTAFELLAQREPYEWTHPHLAKEIMALGILAFGDDRVVGSENGLPADAFAVTNDGLRVFIQKGIRLPRSTGRGFATTSGSSALTPASSPSTVVASSRSRRARSRSGRRSHSPVTRRARASSLPAGTVPVGLLATSGTVVVAARDAIYVYASFDSPPVVIARGAIAVTAKPDGTALYALDASGIVRAIDPVTGLDTQTYTLHGPGSAIAYALSPNRLFIARSDTPSIDVIDLEGGAIETVPLANDRTGTFTAPATALAVVTRTQFLYALTPGKVVVIETHGASPFASIPVNASDRFLGVDGEDDKLLVAGADSIERIETGRHALAWRIPGVLLAGVLAFFLVLLARRLFASPLVAYFTGAAVVLDGSMFAQARIGMNDIYVTAFIVAAWYFIVAAYRPRRRAFVDILIAGVLLGLAVASKWAGVYTLAGVFVASMAVTAYAYERGRPGTGGPLDLFAGRGRNAALLFGSFAVIPALIYLAAYRPWFGGPMQPYGWNLWELTQQMYWYHSSLTAPHCAGSPWWSWPLELKPVYWYFGQSTGGFNGYIYDAGNPILFWAALPAAAIAVGLAIRTRSAALGLVALAFLAQYVAWIPISRVLFFYHFFTALPFYLLLLAVVLALLWERRRRAVLVFGVVAAVAFVVFYPFVSGLPIPGDAAGAYFILPTWQYDPAFYPTDSCPTPISANVATSITVTAAWAFELASLARRSDRVRLRTGAPRPGAHRDPVLALRGSQGVGLGTSVGDGVGDSVGVGDAVGVAVGVAEADGASDGVGDAAGGGCSANDTSVAIAPPATSNTTAASTATPNVRGRAATALARGSARYSTTVTLSSPPRAFASATRSLTALSMSATTACCAISAGSTCRVSPSEQSSRRSPARSSSTKMSGCTPRGSPTNRVMPCAMSPL